MSIHSLKIKSLDQSLRLKTLGREIHRRTRTVSRPVLISPNISHSTERTMLGRVQASAHSLISLYGAVAQKLQPYTDDFIGIPAAKLNKVERVLRKISPHIFLINALLLFFILIGGAYFYITFIYIKNAFTTVDATPLVNNLSPVHTDGGTAIQAFMQAVEREGLTARDIGSITKSGFSVPGELVHIDTDTLSLFEYPDTVHAVNDASSTIHVNRMWYSRLTLYQKDTLVVFYLGTNPRIQNFLDSTLGSSSKISQLSYH